MLQDCIKLLILIYNTKNRLPDGISKIMQPDSSSTKAASEQNFHRRRLIDHR